MNETLSYPQPVTVKRESSITQKIRELENAINMTAEIIKQMTTQLEPVLRSPSESKDQQSTTTNIQNCRLATELNNLVYKTNLNKNILLDIMERLEIQGDE